MTFEWLTVHRSTHHTVHNNEKAHISRQSAVTSQKISATDSWTKEWCREKLPVSTERTGTWDTKPCSLFCQPENQLRYWQKSLKWTRKCRHTVSLCYDSLLGTHFGFWCTWKERSGGTSVESRLQRDQKSVCDNTLFPPLRWMKTSSGEEKPDFVEQFISPLTAKTRTYFKEYLSVKIKHCIWRMEK